MPFLGAIFKGLRGAKRTFDLPNLIEEMKGEANRSLLDEEDPIVRYRIRTGLLDAMFVQALQTRMPTRQEKRKYISRLKEELRMASEELSQLTANKAEVAALAIGLKEMSINLDQQVVDFHRKGRKKIQEDVNLLQQQSKKQIKALATQIQNQQKKNAQTVLRNTKEQIENLDSKVQSQHAHINTQVLNNEKNTKRNLIVLLCLIGLNLGCLYMCYSLYQTNLEQKVLLQHIVEENASMQSQIESFNIPLMPEISNEESAEEDDLEQ